MLPDRGSGTLTFLFTDVEGSTRLWERFPQAMKHALERHDSILLTAVTAAGGQVVKTTGDGLMAVFGSAAEAVRACLAAQRSLLEEPWQDTGALRVGWACTPARPNRGRTTTSVLRSSAAPESWRSAMVARSCCPAPQLPWWTASSRTVPASWTSAPTGSRIWGGPSSFQLLHPRLPRDFPPLATPDRRPNNLPTQASTFIGRDTELREIRDRIERVGTSAHPHGSRRHR